MRRMPTVAVARERMLRKLEREGVVTRGRGKVVDAPAVRLPRGVTASSMVIEDRG